MSLRSARFPIALGLACAAFAQSRPFSPSDLRQWREITDARINPDGTQIVYGERSATGSGYSSRLWLTATTGGEPRALSAEGANDTSPRWSPDGDRIAFLSTRGGAPALYVRSLDGAGEVQLTRGDATPLAFAWSDTGLIAYTARVSEVPPSVAWAPPALLPQLRAPHTRLFLVKASGGETTPVPLGALEPFGEPAWFPDGRALLLSLAEPFDPDRPLQGPELYSLRLPDFALRRMTRHPGPDTNPLPSPDGSRIAWIARDPGPQGYSTPRLWVANPDGSRARSLAGALDREPLQPAWSSDSRTLYFVAEDRGERRIYAARNDGSVRAVLSAPGLHAFTLADNGRAAAVRSPEELVTFPVDLSGTPVALAAPNRDLLAAHATGAIEPFEFRSGPRTLQAWLTLPPGFDPSRRYPLLLAIEDAPRRMCSASFDARAQIYAATGMIVLCANARGAPGYGEAFGNLIRTGFPGDDFDDWMAALDAVAARPYVDAARLRIVGGVSAAWAIGHTARFQRAVARRPIAEFTLDIATSTDGPYRAAAQLGALPWTDPEYYWKHSPLYYAAQFRTPTLILAAAHDPQAEALAFALRTRKVESALLRFGDAPADAVLELEAAIAWLNR